MFFGQALPKALDECIDLSAITFVMGDEDFPADCICHNSVTPLRLAFTTIIGETGI